MIVVVSVFGTCWLPYHIYFIYSNIDPRINHWAYIQVWLFSYLLRVSVFLKMPKLKFQLGWLFCNGSAFLLPFLWGKINIWSTNKGSFILYIKKPASLSTPGKNNLFRNSNARDNELCQENGCVKSSSQLRGEHCKCSNIDQGIH